ILEHGRFDLTHRVRVLRIGAAGLLRVRIARRETVEPRLDSGAVDLHALRPDDVPENDTERHAAARRLLESLARWQLAHVPHPGTLCRIDLQLHDRIRDERA